MALKAKRSGVAIRGAAPFVIVAGLILAGLGAGLAQTDGTVPGAQPVTPAAPAPGAPAVPLIELAATPASPAPTAELVVQGISAQDLSLLRDGLAAAQAGRWSDVRAIRAEARDPLIRKILLWRLTASPESPAAFDELQRAHQDLPDWPGRETTRRRAEQAAFDSGLSPTNQIAWLVAGKGPISGDGQIALAQAYLRAGRRQEAIALARETWRERALTPRAEGVARMEFAAALSSEDHVVRMDRLLWREERGAAERLMAELSGAERLVARARLTLQQRPRKGLQAAVDAVPESRRDDPGLLFERARYIRRTGRPEDALAVAARINPLDATASARAKIAEERRLYVPRALRGGDPRLAYRLVSNHGLTSGEAFADAEWLAGWLSLRFLKEPTRALEHFSKLDANVSTPVSRARALYWRAEAMAALGQREEAVQRLTSAAELPFTFYGQLAAQKLNRAPVLSLGDPPAIDAATRDGFENRDLVRALRLLARVGDQQDFESIAFFLDDQLTTSAEHEMLAAIARESQYMRTAVRSAKAGLRRGIVAKEAAYPLMRLPEDARGPSRPEPAFIHAITRQESEFDPRAISPVGARGLMQLMPATAQITARRHGFAYSRDALLDDPAYNVSLGAAHLQDLLAEFNGSYVLTIAAYNAGGSRARQWIGDWGDPRSGAVDVVDWIELIPFAETRNYVMRVMENLQVYRYRIAGAPTVIALESDLKRGGS